MWLPSKAPFWHMPDLYTLSYVNLTVKGISTPVLTTSISPIQLPLLANKLFIMPPHMRNIHEYMWVCFSPIRMHCTLSYILQTLNFNKSILGWLMGGGIHGSWLYFTYWIQRVNSVLEKLSHVWKINWLCQNCSFLNGSRSKSVNLTAITTMLRYQ